MKTTIRGYVPKKPKPPTPEEIFKSKLGEVDKNISKSSETLAQKIQEVDEFVTEAKEAIDEKLLEVDQTISDVAKATNETLNNLVETANEVLENLKDGEKGEKGDPGETPDPEVIAQDVLSRVKLPVIDEEDLEARILSKVPKIDEKRLLKRFLDQIPDKKGSLKIIQEKIETDPMSVIDKILELLKEGKLKLKTENIDGLDQTISAIYNQVGNRGYLHGGGDTVVAGTNITITSNANGTKTISATESNTVNVVTKTSNYTMTNSNDVVLVDSSSGNVTITLQAVASATVKRYTVKKIDSSSNTVTVQGNGVEQIDGANTQIIRYQYNSFDMVPNGSFWSVI